VKRSTAVALGISVLLVAAGGYVLTKGSNSPRVIDDSNLPQPSPQSGITSSEQPAEVRLIIGNPQAKLTILEYSDPQCPICKRFFEQTEPQLLREYIDTGKANLEIKVETHIGPASKIAGGAWYCAAEQGRFRDFHDQTFTRQGREQFTAALMKSIAGKIGLDQAKFDECLDDGKYAARVESDNHEAGQRINGTPTFFIGNQKIVGAQPFSVFKPVIDSQL
jgi:protein-disulfide isomerase